MSKIRPIAQLVFFGIFMVLMITGRAQIWMGFIFLSIILAAFFGRFYCGWACPINTLIRPANWIAKRLGIQKKEVPEALKSGKIRWAVFSLFLVGLGYTIYTITQGRKFPLPLIIIPIGLLTTIFVNEESWHRYLCPWGVLFSITGRFAKFGIKPVGCSSCSICKKECPGDAITIVKDKGAVIDTTYCLLCLECESSCPINALSYKSLSEKSK